jgi:hypothetical protein
MRVIALPRIVVRLLAGLVVPSATSLTRDRIGERARLLLDGLHHECPPAPASA